MVRSMVSSASTRPWPLTYSLRRPAILTAAPRRPTFMQHSPEKSRGTLSRSVRPRESGRTCKPLGAARECIAGGGQSDATTLPSPLVGEGQGEGCNSAAVGFISNDPTSPAKCSRPSFSSCRTSLALSASRPPLSLSLPHKGGGNRGAAPSHLTQCTCGRISKADESHLSGSPQACCPRWRARTDRASGWRARRRSRSPASRPEDCAATGPPARRRPGYRACWQR